MLHYINSKKWNVRTLKISKLKEITGTTFIFLIVNNKINFTPDVASARGEVMDR